MAQQFVFEEAFKANAKGRIALVGPGGSGKSLTMLRIARLLAGSDGRIAAVDTEQGSLEKYAISKKHPIPDNQHIFRFNRLKLQSYSHENLLGALTAAEEARFDVFCCDSLSHFWMGKDGALEFVDEQKKRAKDRNADQMEGWKLFRPHERKVIDRLLASPCHVIVTMRTKNEYRDEEYTNNQGQRKTKRVKIGLAPVQREGLDYEFDFVGLMTEENDLVVEKTRCPFYAGKVLSKPAAADFAPFQEWLMGDEVPIAAAPEVPVQAPVPWQAAFDQLRLQIGSDLRFDELLLKRKYSSVSEIPNRETAEAVYKFIKAFVVVPLATPAPAADSVPGPPNGHPILLVTAQALWARMATIKDGIDTFKWLLNDLADLTDDATASQHLIRALGAYGIGNVPSFKSLDQMKKCARGFLETIQGIAEGKPATIQASITDAGKAAA